MGVEGRSTTISLPIELPRSWFYSLPLTLSAASMVLTAVYLLLAGAAGARPAAAPPAPPPPDRGDSAMTLLVLFGLFALLVIIEVPVAFAMGLASIATIAFTQPIPLSIVVQRMGTGLDSFVLIAIPLFVLAGHLLNRAGIADRIFEFAAALVGHIRGGLAHVNVVASMIFAGMSGVAQADAAGPRRGRGQRDAQGRLRSGLRRGRERRLGHHRPDHPALGDHGRVRGDGAGRRSPTCSSPASCPAS